MRSYCTGGHRVRHDRLPPLHMEPTVITSPSPTSYAFKSSLFSAVLCHSEAGMQYLDLDRLNQGGGLTCIRVES